MRNFKVTGITVNRTVSLAKKQKKPPAAAAEGLKKTGATAVIGEAGVVLKKRNATNRTRPGDESSSGDEALVCWNGRRILRV